MRRQIRQCVFETNSSSVHAITVSSHKPNKHTNTIYFKCGEFGWEIEKYGDFETKASYLWTAVVHIFGTWVGEEDGFIKLDSEDYQIVKEKIQKACENFGIENITFQESFQSIGKWSHDCGYIDHIPDRDFVDELVNDEDRLQRYLFCDDSYVVTGNDNYEFGKPISPTKDIEWVYYKNN